MTLRDKVKLFAGVCVLLSMLLLGTTWIKVDESLEYDFSDYQYDVNRVLDGARFAAAWAGYSYDFDSIEKMADALLDGKLSALEIDSVCKGAAEIIWGLGDYVDFSSSNEDAVSFFYGYRMAFWGGILAGFLTILSFYLNRFRGVEYVFFGCQVTLMILCFVMAYKINGILEQTDIVHLTVMPGFAVMLALPIKIKAKLCFNNIVDFENLFWESSSADQVLGALKNLPHAVHAEKWTCPSCGKENAATAKFCSGCGNAKPKKPVCPSCGTAVADEDVFCPECGNQLVTSVQKAEARVLSCKKCGSPMDEDSLFCRYCGAKFE